jgi:hypothetical protein
MPLGIKRMTSLSYAPVADTGRDAVTMTAYGSAQLDTAQYKFGTASLYLTNTTDYVDVDATTIDLTTDFTIDFWVRFESKSSGSKPLVEWYDGATFRGGIFFDTNNDYGFLTYFPGRVLDAKTGGTSWTATNTGQWYHIQLSRSGNNFYFFLDGTLCESTGATPTFTLDTFRFGRSGIDPNCWLDDIRVSSVARNTTSFTAPTSAHTNDADTVLLAHMDGTDGSTTFEDDNS